jgi:uncharacterized membrane protein
VTDFPRAGEGRVGGRQELAPVFEQRRAGRREAHLAGRALEQLHAELALELGDARDTACWARCNPPAARVKFASSATATKARSWRRSGIGVRHSRILPGRPCPVS